MKKSLKYILLVISLLSASLVIFSSSVYLYESRGKIKKLIKDRFVAKLDDNKGEMHHGRVDHNHGPRYLVNPLETSKRQLPPTNLSDLKIEDDADISGQWSAPFDWNVQSLNAILLPDETVLTYGSFGIINKEKSDLKSNKKITLSDGRKIERDKGNYQYAGHDVNSGVDFDIWDIKKGVGDEAHKLYNKPVMLDAFCTVTRVLDDENVLIVGGSKNNNTEFPDTQKATVIYNVKEGTFKRSKDLNYKRWYGSVVRTADEKLIMLGGVDVNDAVPSIVPEIIDLNNISEGWTTLEKAKSAYLFGDESYDEWNYPRSYLSSDGNIVGISYNKIWVMEKEKDYRISQTSEIPLAEGGIARHFDHKNPNQWNEGNEELKHQNHGFHADKLRIVSMGAAVGSQNSTVMIGKDQVYAFGGKQYGNEYTASNQVYNIDFSDSKNPKVNEISRMAFPRANLNATILPNGEVFLNGGQAYNESEFSIFTPEIYNVKNGSTRTLSPGYFRRNYHSVSLLLPDGRILVSGGDVWNSEIFYPPYLFTRNWENKLVLSERPKIINLGNELRRGEFLLEIDESKPSDIDKITLISTGATTHAQGSEPKFRSLKFKRTKNKFLVDIPLNKNELANGMYMLFAVRTNGVPSEGKIINLN